MDLAEFQLDMDMLRSMSSGQQPQQQQQQTQQQQHANNVFSNMDLLFNDNNNQNMQFMNSTYIPTSNASQNSTPAYNTKHQNDYFGDDDILTPLISPAITPSFTYQQQKHHHNNAAGNDIDFSPLSSPAMMPQRDHQQHQLHQSYHQLQQQQDHINSAVTTTYNQMTRNQMCEQYEQLEQAKLLITRRLTEMQKHHHQQQPPTRISPSNHLDYMNEINQSVTSHPKEIPQNNNHIEPVTPASLMNLRQRHPNKNKKISFATTVTATAALNELDLSDNIDQMTSTTHSTTRTSIDSSISKTSTSPPPTTLNGSKRKGKQFSDKSQKKSRRSSGNENHNSRSNSISSHHHHASPRALKPLLISPSLTPDNPQFHSSSSGIGNHPHLNHHSSSSTPSQAILTSVKDAEHILATKSNYQNLMEGKAAALGIAFSPQIKSGLEVRRTAHKAAEQKRRDSLKEWFDRLRREVEDGYVKKRSGITSKVIKEQQREKSDKSTSPPPSSKNNNTNNDPLNSSDDQLSPSSSLTQQQNDNSKDENNNDDQASLKPLSKVLLLRYAFEYITYLKQTLKERDDFIQKLTNESDSTSQDEEDDDDQNNHVMKSNHEIDEEEDDDDDVKMKD
ncbi:unnamed protein product [Cunninghamella blakesleeana]